MKSKVYGIITEALKKAQVKFDTDCENIWVDPPQGEEGRTVSVNVMECEDAENETPQQQDEPTAEAGEDDDDLGRFMVDVSATLGTLVEVRALDESQAEEIVNVQWARNEIKLRDLSFRETQVNCTGRLD